MDVLGWRNKSDNAQAINGMLAGLPFELQDGSISTVVARVPWPNPLTSTIGLSLQSLHLTFRMTSAQPQQALPTPDLAESVASMADSFLHDELDRREEAELLQSLHPSHPPAPVSQDIPGGLDPFVTEDNFPDVPESDEVSIFSTMVEHLLARFEFHAVDTKITLIKPEVANFTLRIPEIRYGAQQQDSETLGKKGRAQDDRETVKPASHPYAERRTISISGVTVTTRSLREVVAPLPPSPGALTPTSIPSPVTRSSDSPRNWPSVQEGVEPASPDPSSPTTSITSSSLASLSLSHADQDYAMSRSIAQLDVPRPASPSGSSSDMDEETQLFMSQSLVGLPPRPSSRASSEASSMYQSAVSLHRHDSGEATSSDSRSSPLQPRGPSPSGSISTVNSGTAESPVLDQAPANVESLSSSPDAHTTHLDETRSRKSSGEQFKGNATEPLPELHEDTILSLASEPIVITLISSWATSKDVQSDDTGVPSSTATVSGLPGPSTNPQRESAVKKGGRVEISMGVIACALRACHVRDLLTIASSLGPSAGQSKAASNAETTAGKSAPSESTAIARARGVVLLLLPSLKHLDYGKADELATFFAHPLVPPRLLRGYARVFVDTVSATFSTSATAQPVASTPRVGRSITKHSLVQSTSASFTVSDLSVFSFHPHSGTMDAKDMPYDLLALPILITDPNLPTQYAASHTQPRAPGQGQQMQGVPHSQLPVFDVVDWTDSTRSHDSAKLTAWRVRPPQMQQRGSGIGVTNVGLSTSPPLVKSSPLSTFSRLHGGVPSTSAIKAAADGTDGNMECTISVAPLHFFVGMGFLLEGKGRDKSSGSEALAFLDECAAFGDDSLSVLAEDVAGHHERVIGPSNAADTNTAHSTPRARILELPGQEPDTAKERRRLERLVLDDFNLYSDSDRVKENRQRTPARQQSINGASRFSLNLRLPMIRIQVRAAPPPHRETRSGALILDIHDLIVANTPSITRDKPPQARFATSPSYRDFRPHDPEPDTPSGDLLLRAGWTRLLVSYVLVGERKAAGILSLGPISHEQDDGHKRSRSPTSTTLDPQPPNLPHLVIKRLPARTTSGPLQSKTVVSMGIPAVFATLSKPVVDGLQLWADDATQLIGRTVGNTESSTSTPRASRNPSLIGSRFFARHGTSGSRSTSGSETETVQGEVPSQGETIVKVVSSEGRLSGLRY